MNKYLISPSLLSADFARLGQEAKDVLAAGADMLHLDVMDNHFVSNLTVGPMVCEALRRHGIEAPIDVHLMTHHVDKLINQFAQAGATYIYFHPEASEDVYKSLELIRSHGCKAGLAINPQTPLTVLADVWNHLDIILLMSVNPGFAGQAFIDGSLDKIRQTRELINVSGQSVMLGVDGGIKVDNVFEVAQAGADMVVAGSAIFSQNNYATVIDQMRVELNRVTGA